MYTPTFEIKVALLGHVSVGKTTVLNALFQEQFSQVSMHRTTAAVNHFRVSSDTTTTTAANDNGADGADASDGDKDNTTSTENTSKHQNSVNEITDSGDGDSIKSSRHTLNQTTQDNNLLREQNIVKQTTFDIKLDQHLFHMRHDTRLVVVDIPGINEAHTSEKYVDYVDKSWDSFDCVVVVMDAVQGVNTEEQVKLLQLVKTNLSKSRDVPVIVLCNKVDDPDDKEIQHLVDEVRSEVERVFDVGDRNKALQDILSSLQTKNEKNNNNNNTDNNKKKNTHHVSKLSPAFIPISAGNAFLYRAASRLQLDKFRLFNKEFVDKIGREEFGRFKWRRFSSDQQYEQVYNIVSDPDQYKERIAVSNFDKLLCVLDYFIGGNTTQTNIIQTQMDLALAKISSDSDISDELSKIYDCSKVLNKPTMALKDQFWVLYGECEAAALKKLRESPTNIDCVHKPMEELVKYVSGLHAKVYGVGSEQERLKDGDRVLESMKRVVREVCEIAIEKASAPSSWKGLQTALQGEYANNWSWNYNSHHYRYRWYNSSSGQYNDDKTKHPAGDLPSHWTWNDSKQKWVHTHTKYERDGDKDINPAFADIIGNAKSDISWTNISPLDMSTILSSIYIMIHNKYFCKYFGAEIARIDWIRQKPNKIDEKQWNDIEQLIKGSRIGGKFVPAVSKYYEYAVRVEVPESMESPMHWGHIAWMFCEYMESC